MTISKHIHSCLLVKENGLGILIDPGNYTFEEKGLDVHSITKLDYILITHEHQDHMYIPFIQDLVSKFPNVKIITNNSAAKILKKENLNAGTGSTENIILSEVSHERVFGKTPPQNVQFSIFGKLTHPGDSLHFNLSTPILALPIQAPWCSLTQSVEYAVSLKPKIIIPIHDWHWNEKAKAVFYQRLNIYFSGNGIQFNPLKTGEEFSF